MSIINDALKKVQESLAPKPVETPPPSVTSPKGSTSLYENPPEAPETLPSSDQQKTNQKLVIQNKVKSVFAFICALAITAGSFWYLYQQYRNNIPTLQRLARKSYFKLIHKEDIPAFKTRSPQDLVPLAQITVNPPSSTSLPNSTKLNIHGIMANGSSNVVLINDQVYQEGDNVDGIKIVKIDLGSITVINNGKEEEIRVKS